MRLKELGPYAYALRAAKRLVSEPSVRFEAWRAVSRARAMRDAGIVSVSCGIEASPAVGRCMSRIESWTQPATPGELRLAIGDGPIDEITLEAGRVLDGVVEVLAFGPAAVGSPRDWHLDPYSGYRWPDSTFGPRVRPSPFPGGPDIIIVWELSRGHDVLRLAQAYHLTQDAKYARAAVEIMLDWIGANPVPMGVNWASSMEAGIRSVNWITALSLIASEVTAEEAESLVLSLWEHGDFIRHHLEGSPGSGYNNNHLVACLSALIALGTVLDGLRDSETWIKVGEAGLHVELETQVLPDGSDFESALGYHGLVFGLLVPWWLSCRLRDCPSPAILERKLGMMARFLDACTAPDGIVPEVGDYDAGRLFRLRAWPRQPERLRDFRDLLGFARSVLPDSDCGSFASGYPDMALWLVGSNAPERVVDGGATVLLSFPDSGFVVARSSDAFLLVDAGGVGQNGRGGHAHDDDLSFVLCAGRSALVVDPGTGVYTGDYRARHWFRGPDAHNAPVAEGYEGHQFELTSAFGMTEYRAPVLSQAQVGEDGAVTIVATRHLRDRRGRNQSASLKRRFEFRPESSRLVVSDELEFQGRDEVQVSVRLVCEGVPELVSCGVRVRLDAGFLECAFSPGVSARLEEVPVSPAYGAIRSATSIVFSWRYPDVVRSDLVFSWNQVGGSPRA